MKAHALISRTTISITLVALGALAGCRSNMADSEHEQHAQGGAMHSSGAGGMAMPAAMSKPSSMMAGCQEMKAQKQKMAAEMKAQDAELVARVAEMNGAPEGNQLTLLAAIVTQMADQRATMHVKMAEMQENMMKHMMKHMEAGKESMAKCPMMEGMKNMNEK